MIINGLWFIRHGLFNARYFIHSSILISCFSSFYSMIFSPWVHPINSINHTGKMVTRYPARKPPGMFLKPCKQWDINYQPQLVSWMSSINHIESMNPHHWTCQQNLRSNMKVTSGFRNPYEKKKRKQNIRVFLGCSGSSPWSFAENCQGRSYASCWSWRLQWSSVRQWKKPWLVGLYRGLYYPVI